MFPIIIAIIAAIEAMPEPTEETLADGIPEHTEGE
jgi:hypothetical protein